MLSIMAVIFLPISTVSSVFGTQFFNTTTVVDPTSGTATSSFTVSRKFWLLWIISIPVTIIVLGGSFLWIYRSRRQMKIRASWITDLEKAKVA
jgi:branched-subunit amino acid ABC-type transport system permease component